jgi:hypothetical protein
MHRFLTLFVPTITLLAHHVVDASFDRAKETAYKATVEKVEWVNPHVNFTARVAAPDGSSALWTFDLASPGHLLAEGWTKSTISVGQVLTVSAFPAKDGSRRGATTWVTWPDGTKRGNKDAWSWVTAGPNQRVFPKQ